LVSKAKDLESTGINSEISKDVSIKTSFNYSLNHKENINFLLVDDDPFN
jgi:hypothetical protein